MKPLLRETPENERAIPIAEFLKTYNGSIPEEFPKASTALLQKFKDANASLFKRGDLWSLDLHRKKVMDWLPINNRVSQ